MYKADDALPGHAVMLVMLFEGGCEMRWESAE